MATSRRSTLVLTGNEACPSEVGLVTEILARGGMRSRNLTLGTKDGGLAQRLAVYSLEGLRRWLRWEAVHSSSTESP